MGAAVENAKTVRELGLVGWQIGYGYERQAELQDPQFALVMRHIARCAEIDFLELHLLAATQVDKDHETQARQIAANRPPRRIVADGVKKAMKRKLSDSATALITRVWGKDDFIGLVRTQRDSFAHWRWSCHPARPGALVLVAPGDVTVKKARELDFRKNERSGLWVQGRFDPDASLAWLYEAQGLKALLGETLEALTMAQKTLALAGAVSASQSTRENRERELTAWCESAPLPQHRARVASMRAAVAAMHAT